MTLNANLTKLATQRALDCGKQQELSHYDAAGNMAAAQAADQMGISYYLISKCLYYTSASKATVGTFDFGKQAANQYLYHDAASGWGYRDNLIESEATQVGIG
ncbi:hypothetical protein MUDAN_DOGOELCO_01975 [Lactiplantibacillus mudanjiangensis]|uniref:SCP domain-containing protein n=1 Tax=Lactiplantibacillus mudanjiangensis TaxID=1296538 RepID=A0A660E935_9LACO|nr:hypothetical protein MUDAN_IGPPGNFN_01783 [Lactiplantibacillus mudanjiangensis]VDG29599.1 hypothetical protein MUDAN_MDHGFNIF_01160 [Lactiplantibacillus mudanjiangensis]VDG32715.1 hypothetical protein MUDAN_DOGOELCO_01975 [Lactiplantibacillus mudanjiangensis]